MSAVPTTQKALLIASEGATYTVAETTVPRPGPQDVLVKIEAIGLNPIEWKIATPSLSYMIPGYPFIPGSDGAGVVVEIGEEVANLKTGDRVVFEGFLQSNAQGTFQQYAITPAALAAVLPKTTSFEAAASLPGTLGTAVIALYNPSSETEPECLGLAPFWEDGGKTAYAGKPILILGGATSLGQYAIQLARASGFSPIITTASPRNGALLSSLGATHVLDRNLTADAVLAELPKLTGGKPIEIALDTVSLADTQTLAYKALAPGGHLVVFLPDQIPADEKKAEDRKRVTFVYGSVHVPQHRKISEEFFARLPGWLEQEIIKPNAYEVVPNGLAGIPGGLERLKNNEVSAKKLVVNPQETP